MFSLTISDRLPFDVSKRIMTDEGFMRVPGRVARTGIQEYYASELQLKDRKPTERVRVYRPPDEVFSPDSLNSFEGADVTIEHPNGIVDSKTFKDVTAGVVVGCGLQDGDFVACELIVKDEEAIKSINGGKVQLSVGYSAMYDDDVPEGADYDFIQRDIRVNHVALVDRARAGPQARISDGRKEVKTMPIKISLDSGRSVEVEDEATAILISDALERLTKQAADNFAELEKVTAEKDAAEEETEEIKKGSSDAAILERVERIADVRSVAESLAGKDFTCDSIDLNSIRRAALSVIRPNTNWKDKSDIYVEASFDAETEKMREEDEDEYEESMSERANLDESEKSRVSKAARVLGQKKSGDSRARRQYSQLSKDAAAMHEAGRKTVEDVRQKQINGITDAWKKTAGEEAA